MTDVNLSSAGKPIVLENISRVWGETVAVDNLSITLMCPPGLSQLCSDRPVVASPRPCG
jgi:hypothetical protein